ncbi:MAG: methylenetetrahydrofolate--tRNA-(uracil(54)-C(5))-methyltransferase (FADH(2)-oxidizing) TrmFO [Myxococcales bacterium]|nr:methylenetetrahydrofolate--tRNA-(uracil(54)-C(5))-methyltransferase (FADH(2)-oxidizing) TrmFO [Myxococcales bacterium]
MSESNTVTIVGAGLAGCEAAVQLARRGVKVQLIEMKPKKRTPAQIGDGLAELVCSNSLRGAALANAVGLLKEELRLAGSVVMKAALACRVPAGGALAVDREKFSAMMTELVRAEPHIELCCREVERIPAERPVLIATGPLTADLLAADLAAHVGAEHLAYYDSIAPIISAESIDWPLVWKQSRYDKGGDDYVNCPFTREEYEAFVLAVVAAEKVEPRAFEEVRYFEGCLPIEVMAGRGRDTLAFGPMKPVGLTNPHTGRRPHAVVQLRPEDAAASAYNLVGFQTRMTWPEQRRVLRTIPGLGNAEFLRYGAVHRNTFVDAPALLDGAMQLRAHAGVYLAGQITGVEGYVESAASGLLCALLLAQSLKGEAVTPPPDTTALGGLLTHLARRSEKARYQPSNITWAHFPPLADRPARAKKRDRYVLMAERALEDIVPWLARIGAPEPSGPPFALTGDEPSADAGCRSKQ